MFQDSYPSSLESLNSWICFFQPSQLERGPKRRQRPAVSVSQRGHSKLEARKIPLVHVVLPGALPMKSAVSWKVFEDEWDAT